MNVAEAAGLHQPSTDRLRVWLATFVSSAALLLVLDSLEWIPEWQVYVDGLVACLALAAAVASIASFNAARHRIRKRVSEKWRWFAYICLVLPMLVVWSFGGLVAVFAIGGSPFGTTYEKQFHFAEVDTTVYLYDSSFLDPETSVFVRRGWLPLREQVMHLGTAPEHVDVVLRGKVLMINGRALELKNRE